MAPTKQEIVIPLVVTTDVRAGVDRCFALSRDIDLHRRSMAASKERAIAGVTSGLIGPGQQVTWQARHFGIWWRLTSKIVDYDRPWRFVDEMQRGPFTTWRHEHRFEEHPTGTRMVDTAQYRLPLGPLGRLADLLFVRRYLRRLLEARQQHIKLEAEHPEAAGEHAR
jgi:ligand-binding SRPBCC domain-containing protein